MASGPHWDADSPELRANLTRVLKAIRAHAKGAAPLSAADIKAWHADMMQGLSVPDAVDLGVAEDDLKGAFRGPPKLSHAVVTIGSATGVEPQQVAAEVAAVLDRVGAAVALLDRSLQGKTPASFSSGELFAVCQLAALLHGEWVRIHPFGNGNGRTARLLSNWVLMRYGIPPVLSPRPRPAGSYASAAKASMRGQHSAMVQFILSEIAALPNWP